MASPRPDTCRAPTPRASCARRYPLPVLARLVEADLVEVVVEADGPTMVVDPIFDRAVAAALAGADDADRAWESATDAVLGRLASATGAR